MAKIKDEIERNREARNEFLDDNGYIKIKVEVPQKGFAKNWINKIIWGDKKHFYEKDDIQW